MGDFLSKSRRRRVSESVVSLTNSSRYAAFANKAFGEKVQNRGLPAWAFASIRAIVRVFLLECQHKSTRAFIRFDANARVFRHVFCAFSIPSERIFVSFGGKDGFPRRKSGLSDLHKAFGPHGFFWMKGRFSDNSLMASWLPKFFLVFAGGSCHAPKKRILTDFGNQNVILSIVGIIFFRWTSLFNRID